MANYIHPTSFEVRDETGNVAAKLATLGWIQQDPPAGEPDPKYWKLDGGAVVEMTQAEKDAVDTNLANSALLNLIVSNRLLFKRDFLVSTVQGLIAAGFTKSQLGDVLNQISDALGLMDHGLLEYAKTSISGVSPVSPFTNAIRNQMTAYIQAYIDAE